MALYFPLNRDLTQQRSYLRLRTCFGTGVSGTSTKALISENPAGVVARTNHGRAPVHLNRFADIRPARSHRGKSLQVRFVSAPFSSGASDGPRCSPLSGC